MDAPRHYEHATSWDELGWEELPNGTLFSRFPLFASDDLIDGPPLVFMAKFPAGVRVPPHTHETDYAELILDGTQTVGKRKYEAGDIRIVKAGTGYGPLIAGPEGATVLTIFRDSRWEAVGIHDTEPGDAQYVELSSST